MNLALRSYLAPPRHPVSLVWRIIADPEARLVTHVRHLLPSRLTAQVAEIVHKNVELIHEWFVIVEILYSVCEAGAIVRGG